MIYYVKSDIKKELNIIIGRVISSHMGPMYIEVPFIIQLFSQLFNTTYVDCLAWTTDQVLFFSLRFFASHPVSLCSLFRVTTFISFVVFRQRL